MLWRVGPDGALRLAALMVLGTVVALVAVSSTPQVLRPGVTQGGLLATIPEPPANEAPQDEGLGNGAGTQVMPIVPAAPAVATPSPFIRVPKPVLPDGPRRVGIQAGHWRTDLAPLELARLVTQTGTTWNGIREAEINLDIADRVKALLEPRGIAVDVLPTMIPPGYVADAVVALHGDGDGSGAKSGFKMAHSTRRTPYEPTLLESIRSEYAAATGLAWDAAGIGRNMSAYYLFSWTRNKYSTAPHTPSVILEMGFVSNDHDRWLMTAKADVVAGGIAAGIVRFLEAHPRDKLFGEDLLIPPFRFVPAPTASPGR